MIEQLHQLHSTIESTELHSAEDAEQFRLTYLSRKGLLNDLFEQFKLVSNTEKKEIGKLLNTVKKLAEQKLDDAQIKFIQKTHQSNKDIDLSLPSELSDLGSRHPLMIVQNKIVSIFTKLGFSVAEGPEIEDDWHNFSALNFPENHPARDMQDTFFINDSLSLRTHCTSVQVRLMEEKRIPLRAIMPGRVYRNEAISARAHCFFHQIDAVYIDQNVSFADLKQTLYLFVQEMFGSDFKVRFRPSFFPFTEPSAEMDISCMICKGSGCNVCKHSGWVEILGCGMVDPNVLTLNGIDPEVYSGFAFGMGVERITMLLYEVKDLRMFSTNDSRFLKQFESA
ncbi:MAG: phenylalanine--tRNA ligase subunit alpha [Bacteroidia bacterium]|jgi:phenylalanyl-tRNA synthetase alpha chain|nr:phenylalanine--tRNA ligase subunit alpha [Bacteroidia bacterium]